MATAATMSASHIRPGQVPMAPGSSSSRTQQSLSRLSTKNGPQVTSEAGRIQTQPPTGTPCDGCRRRNSRCAINERIGKCYSCEFHRQECTFTHVPGRKRSFDEAIQDMQGNAGSSYQARTVPELGGKMPRSSVNQFISGQTANSTLARQEFLDREESKVTRYIGASTDLELSLFEDLPASVLSTFGSDYAQVSRYAPRTFMEEFSSTRSDVSLAYNEDLERLVNHHQDALIEYYLDSVQASFPILAAQDVTGLRTNRAALDPVLLAAIFLFASVSTSTDRGIVLRLEELVSTLLQQSFIQPRLSTIQAALIILQLPSMSSYLLGMQTNAAAFDLGLHQDSAEWDISTSHRSLRKRLAWALYAHDKWNALATGRPSLISPANWTVQPLSPDDFEGSHATVPTIELFMSFITLSTLLSSVLETFYTLSSAKMTSPQQVLGLAKPVQLQLKDWYSQLPSSLKMENSATSSEIDQPAAQPSATSTRCLGFLHLSYFTTEILLHRRIIQSLSPSPSTTQSGQYTHLHHICRLAAKTRLISGLDFLNRLRPHHLHTAFWPVGTRTQFSMIGSFGTLLLATSPTVEEEEFYMARLRELGWTLGSCASSFSSSPRSYPNDYGNYVQGYNAGGEDRLGFAAALQTLDLSLRLWEKGRAAKGNTKRNVKDLADEIREMNVAVEEQRARDRMMAMIGSAQAIDDEDMDEDENDLDDRAD